MLASVYQSIVCVGEAEPWDGLGPGPVSSSSRQQNMICSNFCLFVLHITVLHHAAHTRHTDTRTSNEGSRRFSWLKAHTSAFTFKKLLRHYAKWVPKHDK